MGQVALRRHTNFGANPCRRFRDAACCTESKMAANAAILDLVQNSVWTQVKSLCDDIPNLVQIRLAVSEMQHVVHAAFFLLTSPYDGARRGTPYDVVARRTTRMCRRFITYDYLIPVHTYNVWIGITTTLQTVQSGKHISKRNVGHRCAFGCRPIKVYIIKFLKFWVFYKVNEHIFSSFRRRWFHTQSSTDSGRRAASCMSP